MADFVPVKERKNRRKKNMTSNKTQLSSKVADIRLDLLESPFYKELKDSLSQGTKEKCIDLVCYGLGSVCESFIARYQLALLLALRDDLGESLQKCEVYDPVFTEEEKVALTDLGLHVLNINEEGKRAGREGRVTVFYLPHCGKALYNNLLWANWGPRLENVIVIGNSFTEMVDRTPKRLLENTANFVIKIQPYMRETRLPVPDQYSDVFNDTSVHTFPQDKLATVPCAVWQDITLPVYTPDEAEIILQENT